MIKKYNRIFTFGCSFTTYDWPTWADIICYDNKCYNFGISGSGFDSVLYRLLEVDREYKFNKNDLVIIVLTTPLRWDLIVDNRWSYYGQVMTSPFAKYENKLFCLDGLLFKSYYDIQLISEFLQRRKVNYLYGSVNNLYENIGNYFENFDVSKNTLDLINYISKNYEIKLQDFNSFLNNTQEWKINKIYKNGVDYHPRPIHYFKWIKEVLLKEIDIDIKVSVEQILEIENDIDKINSKHDLNFLKDKYPKFYENRFPKKCHFDNAIYLIPQDTFTKIKN